MAAEREKKAKRVARDLARKAPVWGGKAEAVTHPLLAERGERPISLLDRPPNTMAVTDFAGTALQLRRGVLTETHGGGSAEPSFASRYRNSYVHSFLKRPLHLDSRYESQEPNPLGEQARLEATFGSDERLPVLNTTAVPWRAICHLEIRASSGPIRYGTGWFAGPHTVVTAGHCLFDPKKGGRAREVLVVPGRKGNTAPLLAERAIDMKIHPQWETTQDGEWDIGALIMRDDTMGSLAGSFDFGVFADDVLNQHLVNNGGYPVGDINMQFGTMWCAIGRIEKLNKNFLFYWLDTSEGQSGSPIFHYDCKDQRRIVLGVHTSYIEFNRAVRIRPEVFQWIEALI